jgi:hypothetical protein
MRQEKTATRVLEPEVLAIQEPQFTDTWHPVGHNRVINALGAACKVAGIGIQNRDYSMSPNGARLFGAWSLDIGNGSGSFMLGFRNSLDKSMVLGVCAGKIITVCSNMMFSGEFITFHKHTSGLDDDRLITIADSALTGAVDKMEKLDMWHKELRDWTVSPQNFKLLTYDAMTKGAFSPKNLNSFLDCYKEERALKHGASDLYTWHGAATRLMRNWNLFRASEANDTLADICDDYIVRRAA